MHPIMMLVNATLGAQVRRLASSVMAASVLSVVLAVTLLLLLSGAFSSGAAPADLSSLAQSGTTVDSGSSPTIANGGDSASEVRLENWQYTGKPISIAKARTQP